MWEIVAFDETPWIFHGSLLRSFLQSINDLFVTSSGFLINETNSRLRNRHRFKMVWKEFPDSSYFIYTVFYIFYTVLWTINIQIVYN